MDIEINRLKKIFSQKNNLSLNDWKGAVLFLFDKKSIYLVRRSENMPTHAGQLAFLGGHRKSDEFSPQEVALREFEEETSLSRKVLKIHGALLPVMTARLWPIVPIVAEMIESRDIFLRDITSNGEWDSLIVYDWHHLLIEDNWHYGIRHGYSQNPVLLHPINQNNYLSNTSSELSHLLWGATAQMIWNFLSLYIRAGEISD